MYSREISFRYVIMRGAADYVEVQPVEGDPAIRMTDDGQIKTSLSANFVYDERIDWLSDRIRPEMIIDGVSHALGIFLPATVEIHENETTKYVSIEAYDQCWIVQDTRCEERTVLEAGVNYITAVESLLVLAGIATITATPTSATLQEQREWEIGTSYIEIINELLKEINYNDLWFNADGIAVLEPYRRPTAQNVDHQLRDDDIKSLLLPGIKRSTDIYAAPNVFVCVCDNPDKRSVLVARAENTNMGSPLSVTRRGRKITRFERLDNIANQEELQAYADRLVFESLYTGETVEITTGLLPGYGVRDIVALSYGDVQSICIEHSWNMALTTGGEMSHSLERVIMVYDG